MEFDSRWDGRGYREGKVGEILEIDDSDHPYKILSRSLPTLPSLIKKTVWENGALIRYNLAGCVRFVRDSLRARGIHARGSAAQPKSAYSTAD